jgi:DNA-binding NarL/FixJ family response regulator
VGVTSAKSALRILVADDHEVVRRGVRALLETQAGWEVCAEAANGRDAVAAAQRERPDVAVLDIGMPELNGLEAARQIRKALPQCEVVILTLHESEQVVREVLDVGARGYVLKADAGRDLMTAVEHVSRHKPFFAASVTDIVLQGYLKGPATAPPATRGRLTPRQREIVQLLAEGKSNKEVASYLGISVKTAETHRNNIMHALDFHSMSELVRYAIREKLVEP